MKTRHVLASLFVLGAAPALAQTPPPDEQPPPTPPAPPPVVVAPPPAPSPAPEAEKKPETPLVHSKWDATLYGFAELDTLYDSTQGLNELAGNAAIARPMTYAGDHGQTMFSARNSRIGIKLAAPTYEDMKASAQLEMDFLGNQPPNATEAQFFNNPAFRVRHMNLKLETPALDFMFGQYWQLFGWQSLFQPAAVELEGIPAQVYSRSPQIRLSKTIKNGDIVFDVAVAASRPPQRASATPDGQVGIKVGMANRKALHTSNASSTALDNATLALSAVGRRFAVNNFLPTSTGQVVRDGYGVSVDALVPIVPATKEHHENAFTLTASYVNGAGIADLFTGLSGGVSQPALAGGPPAPTYTPNVDNGLVMFFQEPDGSYTLHPVQWQAFLGGLQYYLPPQGNVFVSANYGHISSGNAADFGAANKVWNSEDWADANLFVDATPAVRFGLEAAWFKQTYVDGVDATNYRAQFSAFFLF